MIFSCLLSESIRGCVWRKVGLSVSLLATWILNEVNSTNMSFSEHHYPCPPSLQSCPPAWLLLPIHTIAPAPSASDCLLVRYPALLRSKEGTPVVLANNAHVVIDAFQNKQGVLMLHHWLVITYFWKFHSFCYLSRNRSLVRFDNDMPKIIMIWQWSFDRDIQNARNQSRMVYYEWRCTCAKIKEINQNSK